MECLSLRPDDRDPSVGELQRDVDLLTKGIEIVRRMRSIKRIGLDEQHWMPPTEFWQRHDAGEFR